MPYGNILSPSIEQLASGAVSNFLPDQISFGGQDYFQYPSDLFDPSKHSHMFIIAPYTGEITNKGQENTQFIKNEAPPIFLKIPTTAETNYSHGYNEEALLYNAREISQGGSRSGGLTTNDVGSIAGTGAVRNTLRGLQALPGGDSARAILHGGARAATELLYDAPKFRDFVFSWKFFPDDKEDEQAFIDFYRYLMFLSAPTYGLTTQRYPHIMDLQFSTVNYDEGKSASGTSLNTVMNFTRCYIESITPSFSPNGGSLSPGGLPQEIDLTVHFKESMALDKDTIVRELTDVTSSHSKTGAAVQSAQNNTNFQQNTGIPNILGSD